MSERTTQAKGSRALDVSCEICGHDNDLHAMPKWLMGCDIIMCHDCFAVWYDGQTDTDKIRAIVKEKRSS